MTTYNLYIYSKNRSMNDKPYDFTLYLQNEINVPNNKYVNVDVMSFYMLNTMYNISSTLSNNTFDIEKKTLANAAVSTLTYTIPDGNYSVLTLRDTLNTLLSGIISIVYNYQSNTYTLVKTDTNYRYYIKNIKCSKFIGISASTEITTTGVKSSYVNMVDYQQVIIKSDLVYQDLNQDNICFVEDDVFNVSQILFWVNKQDVEPFKCISYQNQDGGDSFSYNIVNRNIHKINFRVMNENNKLIEDCPEWFLHLKFSIYEKNNMNDLGKRAIKVLENIYYVLLNMLFARGGKKKYTSIVEGG